MSVRRCYLCGRPVVDVTSTRRVATSRREPEREVRATYAYDWPARPRRDPPHVVTCPKRGLLALVGAPR